MKPVHECFVCLDGAPPLFQVCRCKTARVHAHCLDELIRRVPAHEDEYCPICLEAYDLSSIERRRACRDALELLLALGAFAALGYSAVQLVAYLRTLPGAPIVFFALCYSMVLLLVLYRHCAAHIFVS